MMEKSVVVVGAGPSGLTAALALSAYGIETLLIDRLGERASAPKAHVVNGRSLEILDALGVPFETIHQSALPFTEAGSVRFVSTLTGLEFGHLSFERQSEESKNIMPFPLLNIAQPLLEGFLEDAVSSRKNIHFLRGYSCVDCEESDEHVLITLQNGETGDTKKVKSAYVLAADGAGSPLRSMLGIDMVGPDRLQQMMMIHFEADLTKQTEGRASILYFAFDPDHSGVFIAYDRKKDWVFMHSYDPDLTERDVFTEDYCADLVYGAIGKKTPIKIKNRSPWSMTAQVAEKYGSARVFLIGDAAHRFPPTGGLGMNTGIVDAQNIAWKIASVLKKEAGAPLLATYEEERKPVAETNTQQSMQNAAVLSEIYSALYGINLGKKREYFDKICADNPSENKDIARALEAQIPHFDSINLQIGYRYCSAALQNPKPLGETGEVYSYKPSWEVGASLPHRWLKDGDSLLKKIPMNQFSLLIGPKGSAWQEAAKRMPIDIKIFMEGKDFKDKDHSWKKLVDLEDDGALLLRPDRHIAARFEKEQGRETESLKKTLEHILARRSA